MAKIKATIKKDSPAADIIKAAKAEKQAFKEAVESGNSKQQTAVEWLESEIKKIRNIIPKVLFEQAKQMEKKQTEISDEDIKRGIKKEWTYSNYQDRHWMVEGAKWYREQLKNK